MNELTAGRVPEEFNVHGDDVEVVLVDKQNEVYEVPFNSVNWRGGAKGSVIGNIRNTTTGIIAFSLSIKVNLVIPIKTNCSTMFWKFSLFMK